jgi:hypothetical protein
VTWPSVFCALLIGVAVLESTLAYGGRVAVPYRPANAEVRV